MRLWNGTRWRLILLMAVTLGGWGATEGISLAQGSGPRLLLRSNQPFSVKVPVMILGADGDSARAASFELAWVPNQGSDGAGTLPLFLFEQGLKPEFRRIVEPQLWLASMATAFVLQDPWQHAVWSVTKPPISQEESFLAALGVGVLASACGVAMPPDLVVIGGLNWDNSLSPVENLAARLRAAKAAKFARVVIPATQRVMVATDGTLSNVESLARSLGLQLLLADDLTDAVELALGVAAPAKPELGGYPRYRGAIYDYLSKRCAEELEQIERSREVWPRDQTELGRKSAEDRRMWEGIFFNYRAGMDAYRAGEFYSALRRFASANAALAALANRPRSMSKEMVQQYFGKAGELRNQIDRLMRQDLFAERELNRSILASEGADWLAMQMEFLTGRQKVVIKAMDSGSSAKPPEVELAKTMFVDACNLVEYQLNYWRDLKQLYDYGEPTQPVDVFGRGGLWLPTLMLSYNARARVFTQELRRNLTKVHTSMPWDAELAGHASFIETAKVEGDRIAAGLYRGAYSASDRAGPKLVMFEPGPAYQGQTTVIEESRFSSMSDVIQCMVWHNMNSRLGALEQKYLKIGGSMDLATMGWASSEVTRLRQRLLYADAAAKLGISFAEAVGVDRGNLSFAYEWASHLRESPVNEEKLEALRQYWRCSLIGGLAWQLTFVPRAQLALPSAAPAEGDETVPRAEPIDPQAMDAGERYGRLP